MDPEAGNSLEDEANSEAQTELLSPIHILSHVADEIDALNASDLVGGNAKDAETLKKVEERAKDARNLRVLIGGISGWGDLDGVTMSSDSFNTLVSKYPGLSKLAIKSSLFYAPTLTFRKLEQGNAVASDKIVPTDDGISMNPHDKAMQRKTQDDMLREKFRLKADPIHPNLVTSDGKEVIVALLHMPHQTSNSNLLRPIQLLTQIAVSVAEPEVVSIKSKAPAHTQAELPQDPMKTVLEQLQDKIAA
jgi:hypothetical protein